jgi:hypothetical protein
LQSLDLVVAGTLPMLAALLEGVAGEGRQDISAKLRFSKLIILES